MGNKRRSKNGSNGVVSTAEPVVQNEAFSLISNEKLIALYADLLKCRRTERQLGARRNGLRGCEAATVGVAIDLGPEDAICAPLHGLLTGIAEEAPVRALLLASGHGDGLDLVVGSKPKGNARNGKGSASRKPGLPYAQAALGAALTNKTRKNGKVAVVFDTEEDPESWSEFVHTASVHGLPMIFVKQNGHPSNGTGRRVRKHDKAKSGNSDTPEFPTIVVDSNDVVAVYRVANEAISRARAGRGPTLIDCQPFRLEGAGRKQANSQDGRGKDPVLNMENYLRGKGLFRPRLKSEILAES